MARGPAPHRQKRNSHISAQNKTLYSDRKSFKEVQSLAKVTRYDSQASE